MIEPLLSQDFRSLGQCDAGCNLFGGGAGQQFGFDRRQCGQRIAAIDITHVTEPKDLAFEFTEPTVLTASDSPEGRALIDLAEKVAASLADVDRASQSASS